MFYPCFKRAHKVSDLYPNVPDIALGLIQGLVWFCWRVCVPFHEMTDDRVCDLPWFTTTGPLLESQRRKRMNVTLNSARRQ